MAQAAAEWTDPAPTAAATALPPMQAAEWTDLTLPVLTSVLLRAPPLGHGTVLALLERADGAVAVCALFGVRV